MSIHSLLFIQLGIDILLCLLISFFCWQINRRGKHRSLDASGADIAELKKIMDESRKLSAEYIAALEEGRKNLKALAFSLDDRERRLKELLEQSEKLLAQDKASRQAIDNIADNDHYHHALKIIANGCTEQEVSERLGLTAGEVELINNLKRRRNQESP